MTERHLGGDQHGGNQMQLAMEENGTEWVQSQ